MPHVTTFPFTFIGKTKLGSVYRPYAIIKAYSRVRKTWQPIEVVIDTGADYTLFPKRYAAILGIDITRDCFTETTLGVGGAETVYQYTGLPLRLGDVQLKIPVGFLERDDLPSLLGRLACLEEFRLTFEKRTSTFEHI